jgi:hypothetical protein
MHNVPFVRHTGYEKTIIELRIQLFWPRMKKDVAKLISICMECQRVKLEHGHPMGFLQPLPIP